MPAPAPLPPRMQQFLANNAAFAASYPAASIPKMVDMRARGKTPGNCTTIVLTCIDPRTVPEQFFGPDLRSGVIRNAGGHAGPDAIASIVMLRTLVDVQMVVVVHHTDCGVMHITDAQVAREAKERTPDAAAEIDGLHFGCYTAEELESSVKADVDVLRASPALAGIQVLGFVMETETGLVTLVDH